MLTTSKEQIANIAAGRFKANAGKHKKLMRKNSTVFYVNNEALINKIPTDDFRGNDLAVFNAFKESVTGQSLITSKLVGDSFITTATIDTKATNGNALKYIFETIEAVYNAENSYKNERSSAVIEATPVKPTNYSEEVVKDAATGEVVEDVEVEEMSGQTMDAAKGEVVEEEIEEVEIEEEDSPVPSNIIEDAPIFPGCESVSKTERKKCFNQKINEHIQKNLQYPEIAKKNGIQGRIYVSFFIGKNGVIKNIRTRGNNKYLKEEARRIISKLPKMTPGKQRGREVPVYYVFPISFKL